LYAFPTETSRTYHASISELLAEGNTFDYSGRQISCCHGSRDVRRYEHEGSVKEAVYRINAQSGKVTKVTDEPFKPKWYVFGRVPLACGSCDICTSSTIPLLHPGARRGLTMVSELFFSQLAPIALLWLCGMLHGVWPSDHPTVPAPQPQPAPPRGARVTASRNPLRASPHDRTATPVYTRATPAHTPL
jgi:hypothetical protein